MNFFDGEIIDVVLEELREHPGGRYVWKGYVFREPKTSSVTLSGNSRAFVGNVRMADHYYQIRTSPEGTPIVVEIDETQYPGCGTTDDHAVEAPRQSPARSAGPRDTSDYFDVLVVYTPAARAAAGGTAAMEALIDLAVSETNTIYTNSLINSQVRLVHQEEVDYAEVSFNSDLSAVRSTSDGKMDEVHTLRDEFGADMVSLFINDSQYCGLAPLMTSLNPDPGFSQHAFSAVHWSCATGYYSFAHEMGHNQGAHHAIPETSQGGGLFNYSHGWRWVGSNSNTYRSVMAYSPGTRVNHFSNPNVDYLGAPTGQALGESDEAYNALGINEAADTVANWRTESTGLAVTPGTPYSLTFDEMETTSGTSLTYTLHNLGGNSIDWTATDSAAWATLSQTSGTLAAYSTVDITLDFGSSADTLGAGDHSATITVDDTTNLTTHVRDLEFWIIAPERMIVTLDSDPNWSTTGDWEFGVPLGQNPSGSPDPSSGYTGSNVYGYNLSGDYANNMGEETLTSTAFDLSGLTNTQVSFYRWLGIESSSFDHARFQVSANGSAWTEIWSNSAALYETSWAQHTYDISSVGDNQSTVYLRWVMGTSDNIYTFAGWNIDDISIRGSLPSSAMPEVWVDFDHIIGGIGTVSNPFSQLSYAADSVTSAGLVRIKGDSADTDSAESLTISKPMTIQSENGAVQIGMSP